MIVWVAIAAAVLLIVFVILVVSTNILGEGFPDVTEMWKAIAAQFAVI